MKKPTFCVFSTFLKSEGGGSVRPNLQQPRVSENDFSDFPVDFANPGAILPPRYNRPKVLCRDHSEIQVGFCREQKFSGGQKLSISLGWETDGKFEEFPKNSPFFCKTKEMVLA